MKKKGLNTRGFEPVHAMGNPATDTPGHLGSIPAVKFPPRKKSSQMKSQSDEGQFDGKHLTPP